MKNSIAVFILSLLVCAASAFAWPWGNVGLNVDEPTEQLDVGGNVNVRSNLMVAGNIQTEFMSYGAGSPDKYLILTDGVYVTHVTTGRDGAGIRYITNGMNSLEIRAIPGGMRITRWDEAYWPSVTIKPIFDPVTGVVFTVFAGNGQPGMRVSWTNVAPTGD